MSQSFKMNNWADRIAIGVAAVAAIILLAVIKHWIIHGGLVIDSPYRF